MSHLSFTTHFYFTWFIPCGNEQCSKQNLKNTLKGYTPQNEYQVKSLQYEGR